jgi:hypothetical protein
VDRIVKYAAPLTVTDVRVESGWTGRYVSAQVAWRGYSFMVSRYAHESAWVVDMLIKPGAFMPTFANGPGSRVTRAYTLLDELADATTNAAITAGVWPMTDAA